VQMGKGKNKLEKFNEFDSFSNTFDYNSETKGKWAEIFGNSNPIVVEFACGKGEYTIGLGRRRKDVNYIGIDIKGNRLWRGAKTALDENLSNVKFLRIEIDKAGEYFEKEEVSEAWITFPDPQPQKRHKRLSGGRFLNVYRSVMANGGKLNIKTDSDLFYQTALEQIAMENLSLEVNLNDIYSSEYVPEVLQIKTFYEQIWLNEGKKIKYLRFELGNVLSDESKKIEIPEDMPLSNPSQMPPPDFFESQLYM